MIRIQAGQMLIHYAESLKYAKYDLFRQPSYNGLTSSVQKTAASGIQTTTSTNNVLGQLQSVKDSNNGLLTYFHDAFGNLKKTQSSGMDFTTSSIVMGYDIRGNKISMNDPDMGDWTYRYNSFGELVEQVNAKVSGSG